MDKYPTIHFIVSHGRAVAFMLGALPLVCVLAAVVAFGLTWWLVTAGVAVSVVAWFLARSYVELVQVMADMLLPK
jgi:hypothetical protein